MPLEVGERPPRRREPLAEFLQPRGSELLLVQRRRDPLQAGNLRLHQLAHGLVGAHAGPRPDTERRAGQQGGQEERRSEAPAAGPRVPRFMAAEDTRAATPTRTSVRRLGAGGQAGFRSGAGSPPLSPSPPSPASGPASSGETGAALPDPSQSLEHRRTGARPGFETPGGGERFADLDSGMEFPDGRLPFPDFVRRRRPQHPPGQRLAAGIGPPVGEPLEQLFRAEEVQMHAQLRLSQFADPVEAAGKPLVVLERRTALRRSAAADRGQPECRTGRGLLRCRGPPGGRRDGGARRCGAPPAPGAIADRGEDEAGEDRRRHEQPPQRKKPGLPADERQRQPPTPPPPGGRSRCGAPDG